MTFRIIKSEDTIRKDEWDKLHKWFNNYCEGNEEADLWMAFIKAERALRQAGEPDA